MPSDLVEQFCTVPFMPITDFDTKAIASAEGFKIPFEEQTIPCYSWGEGKTVLLAHGWGSRASHFAPLARILCSSGFQVVAFDAPGHSSLNGTIRKDKSNMFEFCKAISTVAKNISPVYAMVGHSLGAASSLFTVAGHLALAEYKIKVEKLVLISSPMDVGSMIKSFCKINGLNHDDEIELYQGLEKDFNFRIKDYYIPEVIKSINSQMLVIHDADDEEISINEAKEVAGALSRIQTLYTTGSGHYKILVNRSMLAGVKDFLIN